MYIGRELSHPTTHTLIYIPGVNTHSTRGIVLCSNPNDHTIHIHPSASKETVTPSTETMYLLNECSWLIHNHSYFWSKVRLDELFYPGENVSVSIDE